MTICNDETEIVVCDSEVKAALEGFPKSDQLQVTMAPHGDMTSVTFS